MFKGLSVLIPILSFILQTCALISANGCNEEKCGSIVSKCSLTQSCKCEAKDAACYRDCVQCMGKKYFDECCGCVDLCPKFNEISTPSSLSEKSHVEDFEGVPELFDVLVTSPTDSVEYNWNIVTFPIDLKEVTKPSNHQLDVVDRAVVNCTVVYFNNCVSWNKCRQNCRSTGASGYRWFHDGCCECIGSTCINYGINESRCSYCPEVEDEEEEGNGEDNDFDLADDNDDIFEFELFDGNLESNSI